MTTSKKIAALLVLVAGALVVWKLVRNTLTEGEDLASDQTEDEDDEEGPDEQVTIRPWIVNP